MKLKKNKKYNKYHPFFSVLYMDVSEEAFTSYLEELSKNFKKIDHQINYLVFYNYMKLPCFLCKIIFKKIVGNIENKLTQEQFVSFFFSFYQGDIDYKIDFIFDLFDANSTKKINIKDTKIIFSHLYTLSKCENLQESNDIIDEFFDGETEMTYDEYENKIKRINSDLFFLFFYYFMLFKPFDALSINYYANNIYKKPASRKKNFIEEFDSIAIPSSALLSFLGFDDCSEFDDLNSFEASVSEMISNSRISEPLKPLDTMQIKVSLKKNSLKDVFLCFKNKKKRRSSVYQTDFVDYDNKTKKKRCSILLLEPIENEHAIQKILDQHIFSSCFQNHKKETFKMDIVGKDIYIFQLTEEKQKFRLLIPIKDISVSIDEKTKNKLIIVSSLLITNRQFKLYFDTEEIAQDVFDIISRKTNFVSISDTYCLDSFIAKGSYGTVIKSKDLQTNVEVAVKIIKKTDISSTVELEQIRNEQDISNFFKVNPQENIIRIIDVFESMNAVYIIQEYVSTGDLHHFSEDKELTEPQLLSIIRQITKGMEHYSTYGIVHRDLKPKNILVDISSSEFKLKIIDFGFGIIKCTNELIEGVHGTISYIAPEVLKNLPYNNRIDVWSFGMTIFYLCYHFNLFDGESSFDITKKIVNSYVTLPEYNLFKNPVSKGIKNLIGQCLIKETSRRPKIFDLVNIVKKME